jgi:hypothetical protein
MKYLGWILLLAAIVGGVALYSMKYQPLLNKLDQQIRETEMWMSQTEQMKRKLSLDETRQKMAPDADFLLADLFPGVDSFNLTRFAKDTLATLANELRRTRGDITVSVFTDDADISLMTKLKYPDAFSYSAGKGAVVIKYLQGQGVAADRITLVAHNAGRDRGAALPDLKRLASRRLEISVRTAGQ